MIGLSSKVTVQQRVVYDFLMMFGDVGGLNDFIALALTSIFGLLSERLMQRDLAQNLFHVTS